MSLFESKAGGAESPAAASSEFLSLCVASRTGNPMLEEVRERGASVLMAVYRLVKNAMVHAVNNDALLRGAADVEKVVRGFSESTGAMVTITYHRESIFVCGQLLRASRSVYESAQELGAILERCEVSELAIEQGVTTDNLLQFVEALASVIRDRNPERTLMDVKFTKILVRRVDLSFQLQELDSSLSHHERVLRLYASALVVMRQFFSAVAAGQPILPFRVKRIAQRLVAIVQDGDEEMLAMTSMAGAHRDDAGRAVQSAILALVVGRQLTTESVPLARLVMAALMIDVARIRLQAETGLDKMTQLPPQVDSAIPATAAGLCIVSGGVNVPSAHRAVIVRETTWLERSALMGGPPYDNGLSPMLQPRIIVMVRQLLEAIAPRDGSRAVSPVDAIERVISRKGADPGLSRLIVRALGLIPTGSVVEFETGEWAVVVGASENPNALQRPRIRLVTDKAGDVLVAPFEIDLGTPDNDAFPKISRVLQPSEACFNVASVFG